VTEIQPTPPQGGRHRGNWRDMFGRRRTHAH